MNNIFTNLNNDLNNFNLAKFYYQEKQYPSAITFYLRCAEITNNKYLEYYSLILASLCFLYSDNQIDNITMLIEDAIKLFPQDDDISVLLDIISKNKKIINYEQIDNLSNKILQSQRMPNMNIDIEQIKQEIYNIYNYYDSMFGTWGWCPNEKADKIIDCVIETCADKINPICVEIGVYAGKSLFPFGVALKYLNKGTIYAIDPWSNEEATIGYNGAHYDFWSTTQLDSAYNAFCIGLDILNIKPFVSIIRSPSDNAQNIENIAVLHIDGQHTDQLLRDINKYAINVIKNGYCFLDDVDWSDDTKKSISLIESLGFVKVCQIQGCILYKKL